MARIKNMVAKNLFQLQGRNAHLSVTSEEGPATDEGSKMAQWVLKANGNAVPRQTEHPLTIAEEIMKERQQRG
eukprot:12245909-Ditylum_brightwellii.AAC.1